MIQSNELRIGNYTNFGIVYLIENECFYTKKDEVSYKNKWADIQPIPLTPEILEKCGFDGNNHKRRFKKVIESSLTMYFQDGVFSLEDYDWFAQNLDHIKNLHQLQNLYYALTGTELEIKL